MGYWKITHLSREGSLSFETFRKFQNRTVVDALEEYLRQMIQNGLLVSGERLPPERELTRCLSVAHTTLRQALARLKDDGYLEAKRGAFAGTYVTDLLLPTRRWLAWLKDNPDELADLYENNLLLETQAAALAAKRRTDEDLAMMELAVHQLQAARKMHELGHQTAEAEYAFLRGADTRFHDAVASASRSRRLLQAIQIGRAEQFTAALISEYDEIFTEQMHDEHKLLLEAIKERDSSSARQVMTAHYDSALIRLKSLLYKCGDARE